MPLRRSASCGAGHVGKSASSKTTGLISFACWGNAVGTIKKSGSFNGRSNKLGYGGRAAQLRAQGVPGGVIGELARKAQAAPGQKNYHPGKKKR